MTSVFWTKGLNMRGVLPMKQQPILVHYTGFGSDSWGVRDGRNGGEAPFGPTGVTREEAEAWLADPVRVLAAATLQDHGAGIERNRSGQPKCKCGAEWPSTCHLADMIAERLAAAGLT